MKDITDLLEEVHTIVQTLRGDKLMLEDRLKMLEDELLTVENGKKSMTCDLQETKERLGRELQETKERLGRELQETKERLGRELQALTAKLDHVHPEMQSLRNELQNAEVQNNLLVMDLKRKEAEITTLELRLHEYTSLAQSAFKI
jgi:chromosome segregation ATPase